MGHHRLRQTLAADRRPRRRRHRTLRHRPTQQPAVGDPEAQRHLAADRRHHELHHHPCRGHLRDRRNAVPVLRRHLRPGIRRARQPDLHRAPARDLGHPELPGHLARLVPAHPNPALLLRGVPVGDLHGRRVHDRRAGHPNSVRAMGIRQQRTVPQPGYPNMVRGAAAVQRQHFRDAENTTVCGAH